MLTRPLLESLCLKPTVCLTADDLDGLYRLYPDCALRPTEPVCFKASHNIGLVRLGVYVLIPIILALVLSTCLGMRSSPYPPPLVSPVASITLFLSFSRLLRSVHAALPDGSAQVLSSEDAEEGLEPRQGAARGGA